MILRHSSIPNLWVSPLLLICRHRGGGGGGGRRTIGRPQLRHKDVCKREMKALDIDAASLEGLAADHTKWRSTLQRQHLETEKEKLMNVAEDKHVHRKCNYKGLEHETSIPTDATFINKANILLICTDYVEIAPCMLCISL